MMVSNDFVTLSKNEMFQVNGGFPIVPVIVEALIICAVIFVVSVCISAYYEYKDMERQYG
jgi:hypothetical protein